MRILNTLCVGLIVLSIRNANIVFGRTTEECENMFNSKS